MAEIEDVAALLERWRDASGVARLGVAVDATRTIRGLSPSEKRDLAVEVASRVAPQLVPQIRAEQGDLTGEQVSAVVDLIRRADDGQLTELASALRGGDVDGALDLVDDAVEAVAPEIPPPVVSEAEGRVAEPDERVDDALDEAVTPLREEASAHDRQTQPAHHVIDEAEVRRAAEAAAAARAERWKDTSRAPDRPEYVLPDIHFDIDLGDLELPDPTVEAVAPLEQRRDSLPGATATSRAATAASRAATVGPTVGEHRPAWGEPVAALTPAVVAAITATPDGYRRRRAALAAIRAHRLEHEDVGPVVVSMARESDRVWVAGAALDAGLMSAGDLDGLPLSAPATRRLGRRAPR